MFNDERFDFSKESDLKGRLWDQMQQKMELAAAQRSEVSLDSISPQRAAQPVADTKAKPAPAKKRKLN